MFKGIRDERGVAKNTAVRIGTAFLELLNVALSNDKDFDTISFKKVINKPTFMQGLIALGSIIFGEYAEGVRGGYIDENAVGELKRLWIREHAQIGDGASHLDESGKVLPALEVKGDSTFSGNLSSPEFVSAFLGGLGWAIQKKEFENSAGVIEEKYTLEIDNIVVRNTLRVFEMIISQLLGENDNRVFTAMMEVDHYDSESGRLYLDTKGGTLYNVFREGDLIEVQQFNGTPDMSNDWQVIKAYEFRVRKVGVGALTDGVNRLDWLEFDNFVSQIEGLTPDTAFKQGDTLVRMDSESDPARKGIVTIMTVGENMPYIDVLYGLKTNPKNALKSRIGNLEGINTDLFGWLEGFGQYINNCYAVGKFFNAQTGESLNARIAATNQFLKSVYSETIYDISDDENFISNGFFAKELDGWERCAADGSDIVAESTDVMGINLGESAEPLLFNGEMMTTSRSLVCEMSDRDGLRVVRLRAAGIRQSFASIKANSTHKEIKSDTDEDNTETKDVPNTLYFGIRILPITSGRLSVHFVKENGSTGFDRQIDASLYWRLYMANDIPELPWDYSGSGKLVITYSGECYIKFVTISNDPVSDAKIEYSTLIRQTSRVITLQAKKQSKDLADAVANITLQYNAVVSTVSSNKSMSDSMLATILGITVNEDGSYTIPESLSGSNMATWRISTNKQITDLAAEWDPETGKIKNYSTRTQTATEISEAVTSANGTAQGYVNTLKALINPDVLKKDDGKYDYATFKSQTSTAISNLAGKWDENGNLKGYSTTEQTAESISSAVSDGVNSANGTAQGYVNTLKGLINSDVLKDSEGNFAYATFKTQTNKKFASMAGLFDEQGNLKSFSTITQTAEAISLAVDGLATKAEIKAFIKDEDGVTLSHVRIAADRVDFLGKTVINDKFVVAANGDVTMNNCHITGELTGKVTVNTLYSPTLVVQSDYVLNPSNTSVFFILIPAMSSYPTITLPSAISYNGLHLKIYTVLKSGGFSKAPKLSASQNINYVEGSTSRWASSKAVELQPSGLYEIISVNNEWYMFGAQAFGSN